MRRRRILLCASGSAGDVYPFIALGKALLARGCEPILAANAPFEAEAAKEGLTFAPVRPAIDDLGGPDMSAEAVGTALTDPRTGLRFLIRRGAMAHLRDTYDDLAPLAASADLVLTHSLAFAGRLAARRAAIPWRSIVLQPMAAPSAFDPPATGFAPGLDALQPLLPAAAHRLAYAEMARRSRHWFTPYDRLEAELDLPAPAGHPLFQAQFSDGGTFALYSPLLGAPQPDHPPNYQVAGFARYDGPDAALSRDLAAFLAAGPPPIVFTLGTAAAMTPGDFFRAGKAAARSLGMRAVAVGPAPEDGEMFVAERAPFSALFKQAAAVVHAGGIGACAQALAAGVPQVICPHLGDQADNARRLSRLGLAVTAASRRPQSAALEKAIRRAMSPRWAAARAAAQAQVVREDGASFVAAAVVEHLTANSSA